MAFKVESCPVDVTVGAVVAQKRTGIHSGASWRDSLGEVEVLTVGPEGKSRDERNF